MEETETKVPLFRRWSHWYLFVLLFLALQLVLFWGLTKYFS